MQGHKLVTTVCVAAGDPRPPAQVPDLRGRLSVHTSLLDVYESAVFESRCQARSFPELPASLTSGLGRSPSSKLRGLLVGLAHSWALDRPLHKVLGPGRGAGLCSERTGPALSRSRADECADHLSSFLSSQSAMLEAKPSPVFLWVSISSFLRSLTLSLSPRPFLSLSVQLEEE